MPCRDKGQFGSVFRYGEVTVNNEVTDTVAKSLRFKILNVLSNAYYLCKGAASFHKVTHIIFLLVLIF